LTRRRVRRTLGPARKRAEKKRREGKDHVTV